MVKKLETKTLADSFEKRPVDIIRTPVPIVNLALSGDLAGGMPSGLTIIAGMPQSFKTGFGILMMKAFQRKYPDGIIHFYDTEGGAPEEFFKSMKVDLDNVMHYDDIEYFEQLQDHVSGLLKEWKKNPPKKKQMFLIDSYSTLPSQKEYEGLDGKVEVGGKAKFLRSFGRVVTGDLNALKIPMIAIGHVYTDVIGGMYAKKIISGGDAMQYMANNVWEIKAKDQKLDGKIVAKEFNIVARKSRFVFAGSTFPVTIKTDKGGILRWSGLFELALELGYIEQQGAWYTCSFETSKFRKNDKYNNSDFWRAMFSETDFRDALTNKFSLASSELLGEETEDDSTYDFEKIAAIAETPKKGRSLKKRSRETSTSK